MEKSCEYCGKEFVGWSPKQKYCSIVCANRSPKADERPCEYCGESFLPTKTYARFCSDNCRRAFFYHKRAYPECVCKYCGKTYRPKAADRITYCSRECRYEHLKAKPKEPNIIECPVCNRTFEQRNGRKYCSDKCRRKALYDRKGLQVPSYGEKRICNICGKTIRFKKTGGRLPVYCSDVCKKRGAWLVTRNNPNYRARKAQRQARIRGVGKADRFDPFDIFERDKWICQLCGKKAPKYLRGTLEDLAPEIDHIVPLGVGGDHTWWNVQCSHRKCNQEKGASTQGQLRMAI